MTERQRQFLWIVQTAIMVNAVNLTIDRKPGADRSDVSMTGNWGAITEAIRASQRIPDEMTVEEAAAQYCTFMLANQRRAEEAAGKIMTVPHWFARP